MLRTEEIIQELIEKGMGDRGRLEHILSMTKAGRELYSSDKEYLNNLLNLVKDNSSDSKSDETKIDSSPTNLEIESLRSEIRELQDQNRQIEEQLKQQGKAKRSKLRSLGNALLGLILFLFGLSMIFALYYYLTNLDQILRERYYGGDPWVFFAVTILLPMGITLSFGLTSIYYGIRKIAKN